MGEPIPNPDRHEMERRARERLRREQEDLRAVMATLEGQRLIARLLLRSGVFDAVRTATQADASFFEGKRHAGLVLTRLLQEVDRDGFGHIVSLIGEEI